jgi:hypothetical protein
MTEGFFSRGWGIWLYSFMFTFPLLAYIHGACTKLAKSCLVVELVKVKNRACVDFSLSAARNVCIPDTTASLGSADKK